MATSTTPQNVMDVLNKLDASDRDILTSYIESLQTGTTSRSNELKDGAETDSTAASEDFPPLYSSGEDFVHATVEKHEAAEYLSRGDLETALEKFTDAILSAPPSALLYANRAAVLLQLGKYAAAEHDCNEALVLNPDCAKALRVRGKARKELKKLEEALHDLSESQRIDFDEDTAKDLAFLAKQHLEKERAEAMAKLAAGK